ncbi:BamA/TamA family outer membrane protein [Caldithrix abyssi]
MKQRINLQRILSSGRMRYVAVISILFLTLPFKAFSAGARNVKTDARTRQAASYERNQSEMIKSDSVQTAAAGERISYGSAFSYVGFPVVLYMPENSVIFGGGATVTMRDESQSEDDRPNSIHTQVIYTLKNQFAFNLIPDLYFDDYQWQLRAMIAYQKFPDTFYGMGNRNSKEEAVNFTTEDFVFYAGLTRRVYNQLRLGFWFNAQKTNVLEIEPGGLLDRDDLKGINGGLICGIGPVIEWDSRDNIFYPASGVWLQFNAAFYRKGLASAFRYNSYMVDLRYYFSPAESHIIAVQFLGKSVDGEIPFNKYVLLESMRGINGSRFRDKKMFLSQIEYRYPLHNRFSGVVFCALGDVVDHWQSDQLKTIKYSFGFGIRYLISPQEKIHLRVDVGVSRWGINPYFQISEAF